ncbi:MAG: ComEA family DNA-binding protein [Lachnospiraceae bacterium]|nr:ComEA family DNA-binding protein [Lachnospiraceae bacterium]
MNKRKLFLLAVALLCILSFTACGKDRGAVLLETDADNAESVSVISSNETEEEHGICFVHISGAVKNPGVYELPEGGRLYELVEAAGGFTEDAAQDYCNLAQTVSDGCQYRIPTIEEVSGGSGSEVFLADSHYTAEGLLDINLAGREELMLLPGIGETRADAILAYRDSVGRLESTEELMNVSGIKQGLYEQICPYIVVR